ncbi:alpha/beta hydrolase [Dysgonomonas sp. 520]|uniref:alpha/beta hydrolase n=1 Tax=Dysgonomonas sp. 520 TaxID=2302931 RepID=UPI0013D3792F|nr:alpha/beta hydrolase [Dysgonomonas sp. 520]NDW10846.1 alpha/beta hydrolase [Dysgonomonas sp. 520]
MKKVVLFLSLFFFVSGANAQEVINLWNGNPPTDNGLSGLKEIPVMKRSADVSEADMTVYLADKKLNTGKAVIICPGGGYSGLAMDHEGVQVAQWLQQQGITGIVLKYRMPNKHKEVPLDDVQQAFRIVHSRAKEWAISPDKIGIAGSSAGGHLAATASTRFVSTETRPAFSILFYPVITMKPGVTHGGSKNNLLGDKPSVSDLYIYSNENQVNASTPPTILLLSDDDKGVIPENSILYYEALKKNNVPATMYIFPVGGHGWGMNKSFKYHNEMLALLKLWLESI